METQSGASWYLYVIRTIEGCLYAGITTDVKRRYREHVTGSPRAARFLRARPPQALVFKRRIGSHSLALKVEYRFKQLTKGKKESIVKTGKIQFDRESGKIRTMKSFFAESSQSDYRVRLQKQDKPMINVKRVMRHPETLK